MTRRYSASGDGGMGGWNKGMRRVQLSNGRYTYRRPDNYESNSGRAGVAMGGVIVLGIMFLPMLWAPIMGVFTIPFGLLCLLLAAVS